MVHLACRWLLMASMSLSLNLMAAPPPIEGRVVGVTDGDTLKVLDDQKVLHKIRVAGIDAPERKQPFGQRAKARMSALVFDEPVRVLWHKRDRYQRVVGKVMVSPQACEEDRCQFTLDAGAQLVEEGFAWWYRKYAKEQSSEDARRYERLEQMARTARSGLWSDPEPVAPWDWRRGER